MERLRVSPDRRSPTDGKHVSDGRDGDSRTLRYMSEYSIVNLRAADDDTAGRVPGMEGRFGRKYLDSRDLGVSLWSYEPNVRSPFSHSHREQEEAYVVVAGSGRIRLGEEVREIGTWDVVRVAPQVVRAFEAGPDGLELIAVGGPKPEGGDGVPSDSPWPQADGA
jgi:quercetin dioxygenase-like cupin family protein